MLDALVISLVLAYVERVGHGRGCQTDRTRGADRSETTGSNGRVRDRGIELAVERIEPRFRHREKRSEGASVRGAMECELRAVERGRCRNRALGACRVRQQHDRVPSIIAARGVEVERLVERREIVWTGGAVRDAVQPAEPRARMVD